MHLSKILFLGILTSCADRVDTASVAQTVAQTCEQGAPCEVEIVPSTSAPLWETRYRICCPAGQLSMSILEVTSSRGNWGDVTRWVACGRTYSEEFTHPLANVSEPWAILSVFDGNGGPITACQTANAP